MENQAPNPTKVATKWALIYVVTSIIITYIFEFCKVDQTSSLKYLAYIPFIAFLLLAQKEYKDSLGGFLTFGQGFSAGFRYALFGGIIMAVFIFIYLQFLSPQILLKSLEEQRTQMAEKGASADQLDKMMEIGTKYGPIFGAFFAAVGTAIFGAIIALIGAAIFKKERTPFDLEQEATDPAV